MDKNNPIELPAGWQKAQLVEERCLIANAERFEVQRNHGQFQSVERRQQFGLDHGIDIRCETTVSVTEDAVEPFRLSSTTLSVKRELQAQLGGLPRRVALDRHLVAVKDLKVLLNLTCSGNAPLSYAHNGTTDARGETKGIINTFFSAMILEIFTFTRPMKSWASLSQSLRRE